MRHFLVPLCVTALLAPPVWGATVLTFDVVSHTEPAKGAKEVKSPSLPADAHYTMSVTLAGDTLQIDQPDGQLRYDFKNFRIEESDKAKKTYDENSLYTVVGFDVVEFANRMMLARVLAAGKINNNPMAPALTENLMSMSDPSNATVIDRSVKAGEIVYSWSGQPLMTVSEQTRELPPAVFSQYLRFLRYSTGGHPQILAAIERGKGVPERLSVVRSNIAVETRTLALQGIEERADGPLSLDGYARHVPDGEPFATLKRLSGSPAADLEARASVLRRERDTAAAGGRTFDALLANFAVGLATGDQSEAGAWVAAHREEIAASADAQNLIRSLTPQDAASAKTAADTLAKLRRSAGQHGYVLNIFEANVRYGLREGDKAIDLFLAALAVDPTITGAWIDLGGMYYDGFRADAAWACWDAARALRPTHYMLKTVDDRERQLRADHPEFF